MASKSQVSQEWKKQNTHTLLWVWALFQTYYRLEKLFQSTLLGHLSEVSHFSLQVKEDVCWKIYTELKQQHVCIFHPLPIAGRVCVRSPSHPWAWSSPTQEANVCLPTRLLLKWTWPPHEKMERKKKVGWSKKTHGGCVNNADRCWPSSHMMSGVSLQIRPIISPSLKLLFKNMFSQHRCMIGDYQDRTAQHWNRR